MLKLRSLVGLAVASAMALGLSAPASADGIIISRMEPDDPRVRYTEAEQEVAGGPVAVAVAPGLPEGDGDRVAGGAGEGEEPGVPGVDAGGVLACRADGG